MRCTAAKTRRGRAALLTLALAHAACRAAPAEPAATSGDGAPPSSTQTGVAVVPALEPAPPAAAVRGAAGVPGASPESARPDAGARGSAHTDVDLEDAGRPADPRPSAPPRQRLPQLGPPRVLGVLAGPAAAQPGLALYGTDLGWTFEHRGALTVLFGDTWPTVRSVCETPQPAEDDVMAFLSLDRGAALMPRFVTQPAKPDALAMLRVNVNGAAIPMGIGSTPLTGWSDGDNALAVMGHVAFSTCPEGAADSCDDAAGLACVHDLGLCQPAVGDAVLGCDPSDASARGCAPGQRCVRRSGATAWTWARRSTTARAPACHVRSRATTSSRCNAQTHRTCSTVCTRSSARSSITRSRAR